MKRRLILSILLALIGAVFAGQGTLLAAPTADSAEDHVWIDQTITELMATYDVPGVGLAVVQDGAIVYTAGYGLRDTTAPDETAVTAATLFCIGSISKSFTALAIAQQVEAGVLDFDTPIITYAPDLPYTDPRFEQITLRHLLNHTSGLPSDDLLWAGNSVDSREALVANIVARDLTAAPGETYLYNNAGYTVAGYVLEQAASTTWEALMAADIFAPLGMDSAVTTQADYESMPDIALPHVRDIRLGNRPVDIPYNLSLVGPAGSIFASADDMARYALLHLGDGTLDGTPVISPALLTEMHTAAANDYALGWTNRTYEGVDIVWHNGAIDGFYAGMTLVPSENLGIVLLTNGDSFDGAAEFEQAASLSILAYLLGLEPEQSPAEYVIEQSYVSPQEVQRRIEAARTYEPDPSAYAALVGEYESFLAEIRIEVRDGRLFAHINQQGVEIEAELIPFEENRYLGNARGLTSSVFRFEIDEQGTVMLYQDLFQFARKAGEGVELSGGYIDPEGRFTVEIPTELIIEPMDGYVLGTTDAPASIFTFGARAYADEDLQASGLAFVQAHTPEFTGTPVDVRAIPLPNGTTWTQYIYAPSLVELVVVIGIRQGDHDYFITVRALSTDIQAITGTLNALLLSFQFAAS